MNKNNLQLILLVIFIYLALAIQINSSKEDIINELKLASFNPPLEEIFKENKEDFFMKGDSLKEIKDLDFSKHGKKIED